MQPGAQPSTTCGSTAWAIARVRSPPSLGSRSLVTGAIVPPTPCGERARRVMASASLTRPAVTALSRAQSASSGPCVPRPAGRQSWEQAWSWAAAAPSQCSPVLGATSSPRATARRPSPAAQAPPPLGTWRMPPASQATGGQASPGKSQGRPHTGPAARACPPEAHWRGGGPGPPSRPRSPPPQASPAAVDRPCGGLVGQRAEGAAPRGPAGEMARPAPRRPTAV
jgi:hypothetical protein